MQIPNLPTDNLYKFLALSGLALFLISAIYPPVLIHDLNLNIFQFKADHENTKIEVEYIKDLLAQEEKLLTRKTELREQLDLFEIDYQKGNKKERLKIQREKKKILENLNYIDAIGFTHPKDLLQMNANLQKGVTTINQKKDSLVYLVSHVEKIRWISGGGMFLGALLALWGFRLWYNRLQFYYDKIVKNRSQESPDKSS